MRNEEYGNSEFGIISVGAIHESPENTSSVMIMCRGGYQPPALTPHPSFKFFLEFESHLLRQEKATRESARLNKAEQCKFSLTNNERI